MLYQAPVRNLKLSSTTALNRRAGPPSQKDMDEQQNWQNQAYSEMNPTRPGTQSFTTRVVKAIASDGQNGERTQKNRSVCSIASRTPRESHMRVQEHPDQY